MTGRRSKKSNDSSALTSDSFKPYREKLAEKWMQCGREAYGDNKRAALFPFGSKNDSDLLSIVSSLVDSKLSPSEDHVDAIRSHLRTKDYSVSDLFREHASLQTAMERCAREWTQDPSQRGREYLAGMQKMLNRLSQAALRGTAEFLENVIEDCHTGFCQTDVKGRIVYANDELHRIAAKENLRGTSLEKHFEPQERRIIRSVFAGKAKGKSINQQLHLIPEEGDAVPVGVELSMVRILDESVGAYAFITDLTRPMRLQNEIFDRFLLGIIRLDLNQRMTYTNKSIRDMLGLDDTGWKGAKIDTLVPKSDLRIIRKQLKERFEGKSNEYEICFLRQDVNLPVPVMISASPKKDLQGNVIGTMGIIRPIVGEKMHNEIESSQNSKDLLTAISELLRSAVPFDRLHVAVFSKDKRHVRNLFTYSPNGYTDSDKRWWEMSKEMLLWSKRRKMISVKDLSGFYDKPEFRHLKAEKAVKEILREFKSFIYYPIFMEKDLVACIAMYSASSKPYTQIHCKQLEQLPVDTAVLTALSFENNSRLLFLLELMKEISSKGSDVQKTAQIIVSRIAEHFEWESASLFRVNRMNRRITLLSQSNLSKDFRIPEDYEQSIDEGILGEVYARQDAILIGDVTKGKYKKKYKKTVPKTRSELCMPIASGDLCWLLNIEDPRKNAFSEDEKDALKLIVDEIKVFMERTWLRSFLDKALISTSDAVLVIDDSGHVTLSNSAAQRMLGYMESELQGKMFKDMLVDSSMSDDFIQSKKMPNYSVWLKTKTGKKIHLLLSKFQLHEQFNANIIVAKDLSLKDRVQELEYIGKLYYELAIQTKTPLTLAFSWLQKANMKSENSDIKELTEKTLRQLRKLNLTFNRLAMYDKTNTLSPGLPYQEMLMQFDEIANNLTETFTKQEMNRIQLVVKGQPKYLRGDPYYITFCFETIYSYLLRFLPENKLLKTELTYDEKRLRVIIRGFLPDVKSEKDIETSSQAISQTLVDMALGENILRSFINKCGGKYNAHSKRNNRIKFNFELMTN